MIQQVITAQSSQQTLQVINYKVSFNVQQKIEWQRALRLQAEDLLVH